MKEYWLTRVPTPKEFNTAYDQAEGIHVTSVDQLSFVFVPVTDHLIDLNNLAYEGNYCQYIDNTRSNITGPGQLIVSDTETPEPSARLILLDK